MNLPFFIAKRIARPSEDRRSGMMVHVAIPAVALSIAVMIITLAVIMGFKREIVGKTTGLVAHITLADLRSFNTVEAEPVRRLAALDSILASRPWIVSAAPYATKAGILRTDEGIGGVQLKGVDASYDFGFLAGRLVAGSLPRVGDSVRTKDLLLSRVVADRLRIGVGDKVEMIFADTQGTPRRDRFKVTGIYDSGMEEIDRMLLLTDLRNVQRLSRWEADLITGYEIRTTDFDRAEAFAEELNDALICAELDDCENLLALDVRRLYPQLFDWLSTHDVNAAVVIIIMLVVAFFNMATVLLISVLERTRMIGLLKAAGMTDGALRQIFLWRGAFIVLRGVLWGNVAGLGLCLLQKHFHLLTLDASSYLLSEVPVALEWSWWLALNAGAVAVIVLLMLLPAWVVSTVKPAEAIRAE